MARLLAEGILEEDVKALVGERHSRDRPFDKHLQRWGCNPGSIRIDGERVPIEIPRLRDKDKKEEHTLKSYQAMKEAEVGEELTDSILLGLSQGDYGRVSSQFVDGFGLGQSSVSRRFQKRAQKALEEFEAARWRRKTSWPSGSTESTSLESRETLCMGVTEKGYKKTQATTERSEPIKELLRDLIDRGLTFAEGILCVVDGSRGPSQGCGRSLRRVQRDSTLPVA